MAAYIVRRLIWVIFLLFVVTLVTFIVFTVLPAADPAVLRAGRQPSPELVAVDPPAVRPLRSRDRCSSSATSGDILPFVGGDGINFGYSYQSNQAVLPQILDRMPATIFLTGGAVIIWLAVGIPIGMISAIKTGSLLDRFSMGSRWSSSPRPSTSSASSPCSCSTTASGASRCCRAAAPTRTPPTSSARPRR